MLRTNFLREHLRAGKPVLGTWLVIPSVVTVDIIASTGVDFVIIDREHGPITFETAQEMAIACESRGVSPVMRVGDIERSFIQNEFRFPILLAQRKRSASSITPNTHPWGIEDSRLSRAPGAILSKMARVWCGKATTIPSSFSTSKDRMRCPVSTKS
jgi:hypothetical protein